LLKSSTQPCSATGGEIVDVDTFLEKSLFALVNDAAIKAFCQEHYGRSLSLAYGVDPAANPEGYVYPMASLSIEDQAWNNTNSSRMAYAVEVGLAVWDEGTQDIGGVSVKIGLLRAHKLRELVVWALMRAGIGKVEAGGGVEEVVMDPFFAAYSNLMITN
jgi:hypothetical protein